MNKQTKNEVPKGCLIATGSVVIVFVIFIAIKVIVWIKNPVESGLKDYSVEWAVMTYEQRDSFLTQSIESRSFFNASEAELVMRNAIKNEVRNPKTISYVLPPNVYNGISNVVEADSGWIYVPFKCTAKNDFGIEKEIAGSVTLLYVPATNSLDIKIWDISQND